MKKEFYVKKPVYDEIVKVVDQEHINEVSLWD